MAYRRIDVLYSGHVQGVGFRYTAVDIASGLDLVGWVKNLGDGRVEAVCEGEEVKLNQFLDEIRKGFLGRYIRDAKVNWEEPTREFRSFDVMF